MTAQRDVTIGDGTKMPLRLVISLVVCAVGLAGWMTAVKYDINGLSRVLERAIDELSLRIDELRVSVEAINGRAVQRSNLEYWIILLRQANPTITVPDFPR